MGSLKGETMDGERFDAATRVWVMAGASRRRLLRSLTGAAVAAGLAPLAARAARKPPTGPRPGDRKCCAQLQRRAEELCRKVYIAPDGTKGQCRVHADACIQILPQDPDSCSLHELQCISNGGLCRG
jgi:hypothetical protein